MHTHNVCTSFDVFNLWGGKIHNLLLGFFNTTASLLSILEYIKSLFNKSSHVI